VIEQYSKKEVKFDQVDDVNANFEPGGVYIDARDGNAYFTTVIRVGPAPEDVQVWMTENLRFKVGRYNNLHPVYGEYYFFQDAINATPAGCRLPSIEDYNKLTSSLGSDPLLRLLPGGDTGLNLRSGSGHYYTRGSTNNPGDRGLRSRLITASNKAMVFNENANLNLGVSVISTIDFRFNARYLVEIGQ